MGWWLLALTALLVLGGCLAYVLGLVGWAQFLWVMASGTAGSCVILLLANHD